MTPSDLVRFEAKIEPVPFTTCWIWNGARDDKGYGSFWFGGKIGKAHRASHEHFIGAIPARMVIDHLCRVPLCVNPDHLEAVPQSLNVLRGRGNKPTGGLCRRGHVLATRRDGRRECRSCKRERDAAREVKPKAKRKRAGKEK